MKIRKIIIFPQHNELCQGKYMIEIADDIEDIDEYLYEQGIDYSYFEEERDDNLHLRQ